MCMQFVTCYWRLKNAHYLMHISGKLLPVWSSPWSLSNKAFSSLLHLYCLICILWLFCWFCNWLALQTVLASWRTAAINKWANCCVNEDSDLNLHHFGISGMVNGTVIIWWRYLTVFFGSGVFFRLWRVEFGLSLITCMYMQAGVWFFPVTIILLGGFRVLGF